jgi:hypothetical protein
MKKRIYKMLQIAAVVFCCVTIVSSCTKDGNDNNNTTSGQAYFTSNATNRDLLVVYAKDDNADVTVKFSGYNVRLADTASTAGTITVWNDLLSVKGTWTIDATYNNITFMLPVNIIADLAFLNKQWRFANRESATIKLVAANGESDEVHFSRK